jgi:hypothetical protein
MSKKAQKDMGEIIEKMGESILYEWWYAIAEQIFEKVCEVTELDQEQKEALREVAMRPNDFQVEIEDKN